MAVDQGSDRFFKRFNLFDRELEKAVGPEVLYFSELVELVVELTINELD